MTGQFSCGRCKIEVENENELVQCELCDKWNHVFCVDISSAEYEKLKPSARPWCCPKCANEMPYSSLSNKESNIFFFRNPSYPSAQAVLSKKVDKRTKEILKKLNDLNKLFDHKENAVSCDCFDIMNTKKVKIKEQDSLLHLNISSLSTHINELKTLLSHVDSKFHIIYICDSRISKRNSLTTDKDIPN